MPKPTKQPKPTKRASVLAPRIKTGKADPISSEERAIVAGLRSNFDTKYGRRGGKHGAKAASKNHPIKVA
ncbi:hypothetical protein [Arthrobacter livingstonensis]|uniref:hypothetical protein n=1 Tax=Arthrobacter livingstonensis TaxID=670078 RepID=UPI0011B5A93D|nr:hypothetical protein [Arthrobacter livingstonensis]